jgi:pSer/pThr/pTyr-binding forkhead associated (FHA) protein
VILRFLSGKYESAEFPVEGTAIRIGRDPDFDMVLVDDAVSQAHARISIEGGVVWVEDLGSSTGTFVNGQRIDRVKLSPGDRVAIGGSIMELQD